jgi:hypothetical protein
MFQDTSVVKTPKKRSNRKTFYTLDIMKNRKQDCENHAQHDAHAHVAKNDIWQLTRGKEFNKTGTFLICLLVF